MRLFRHLLVGTLVAACFAACSQSECEQFCSFEAKCRPLILERSVRMQVDGPADCRWIDEGQAKSQCTATCEGIVASLAPVDAERTTECGSCLDGARRACDPESCEEECLGALGGLVLTPANIGDLVSCVPDRIPSIPGGDTNMGGGDSVSGGD